MPLNLRFTESIFSHFTEGNLKFEIGTYGNSPDEVPSNVFRIEGVGEFLIPAELYLEVQREVQGRELSQHEIAKAFFVKIIGATCSPRLVL